MIRRCPNCNSIWVCWNWLKFDNCRGHECWDCTHCFETPEKVRNGIPYRILRMFGRVWLVNLGHLYCKIEGRLWGLHYRPTQKLHDDLVKFIQILNRYLKEIEKRLKKEN